jgi:hypothetical protein
MAKEKTTKPTAARAAKEKAPAVASNGTTTPHYTFITNGYRAHPDPEDGQAIANLEKAKWKDQDELQKVWEERITAIGDSDFVMGGGDPGIFSARFTKQVAQITPLESVWCYSTGLGMINLDSKYPQYDLGEYDSSIKTALEPGEISERKWWSFVCELSGNSITSVMEASIKHGHRVLMAMPPLQYTIFRDDLKQAIDTIGADVLRQHLRILGPELEGLITPKLLPCLMPYDRDALDRLVPGNRSHGIRRLARLFVDVCHPTDGPTNPVKDYERMVKAFENMDREPIAYDTGSVEKVTKLKRLSPADFKSKIVEYSKVCGPIAQRIMRMMREDGIGATTEAIQEVLGSDGDADEPKGNERANRGEGRERDERPSGRGRAARD